jgi:hypothetical protein
VALLDMMSELRGAVPKIPFAFTQTLINRAWGVIRQSNLWSFNLYEGSWISPPVLTTGTVTTVQGSDTVQFDATATAAINAWQIANPYMLVTQCQLRPGAVAGIAQIYNLIQYDQVTGAATLDRMYADPSGTNVAYQLYQLYYAAPFKDHLTWVSVRNFQMFLDLGINMERNQIDKIDPQRSIYQWPTQVVPYTIDYRGQGTIYESATLGFPLFELWGQPVNPFSYGLYGIRKGVDLVNPTDSLPIQVGEDCVLALARTYAYEWAEANKDMSPRSAGPDFKFLIGKSMDEYTKRLILYRKNDKEFVDAYFSARNLMWNGNLVGVYNSQAGVATTYGGYY